MMSTLPRTRLHFSNQVAQAALGALLLISLLCVAACFGGVVVVQGDAPGATNWPATPILSTISNPSTTTVGESFNGGGGNTNLSQTFTIATTNYALQTIEIYASGGNGGMMTLNLYDLGFQTAPNPSAYSSGVNLFGSGSGLPVTVTSQAAGIVEFDLNGIDQSTLQSGHLYAFELAGALNSQPTFWERSTNDTYLGGAAYRNQSWINGNSARDFALAVYGIPTNSSSSPAAICTVDWNTVYQRIDGFGASSAWNPSWTTNQADLFFSTNNGVGLSLLRNRIAPGGTTVETSIMQMAQARGARVWSTPWSPQASFKNTNSVNGGDYVSNPVNNQAYANQLASYVASMKNTYGVNLYALSIQNEPDVNTTNYDSCVWTAQQFHDFVPYLYSALSNYGVASTRIILPEDEHWQFNLATTTLADSNTAAQVSILAGHNYGSSAEPVNTSGKDLWETEISFLSGSDSSISNGVYWAGQIYEFLTIAQVNAWHYWWLVPGNSTGNEGLVDTNGVPAKRLYTLGNFSLFVRPNFYRIGAFNSTGAQIAAFKDSLSTRFAIVAINPSASDITQVFNLTNFTCDTVTPWLTSSASSLASNLPITLTNGWFTNFLPAMSVTTFSGQADLVNGISVAPHTHGAIVSWQTTQPATSQIAFGLTSVYGQLTPLNASLSASHALFLDGLNSSTQYYFQVMSATDGITSSVAGSFSTAVSAGQDLPTNGNPPVWWSSFYYGTNPVAGSTIGSNGLSLLTDYVVGLSPVSSTGTLSFGLQPVAGALVATFAPCLGGRTYQLQNSTTLGGNSSWTNLSNRSIQQSNGIGNIQLINPSAAQSFYRLSVQLQP